MKTIIFILVFYFLSISTTFALTDAQVVIRINNVQGSVPRGTPAAPTNMDQKGYIGEILANIFDVNEKIKSQFISAFQNIYNTGINTLPRWNGQGFVAGTIFDSGTNIGIGTTSPDYKLEVIGSIHVSGNISSSGSILIGDGKEVLRFSDTWLRLNQWQDFTNGVYTPGNIRLDGALQVGNLGSKFLVDTSGNVGIGIINPTQKLDVGGSVRATAFMGVGTSLTALNANNITTGIIPDARLSTNVIVDSGNQTIAGVKTFTSSPLVPTPTTNMQAVNKEYVDTKTIQNQLLIPTTMLRGGEVSSRNINTSLDDGGNVTFYAANTETANYLCREQAGQQFGYWKNINLPTSTGWAPYGNLSIVAYDPTVVGAKNVLCSTGNTCYTRKIHYGSVLFCYGYNDLPNPGVTTPAG